LKDFLHHGGGLTDLMDEEGLAVTPVDLIQETLRRVPLVVDIFDQLLLFQVSVYKVTTTETNTQAKTRISHWAG
jgi:hypothetical protein